MHRIIRINLSKMTIKEEEIPVEYKYLGGRGLTSSIVSNEINPLCHPLSEENKLVIAPGLLAGTYLSSSNRLSVGSKSPLTGGIKESNSGGTFAYKLARLGIKAVIIEGKIKREDDVSIIIKISNNGIFFENNPPLRHCNTYDSAERIRKYYGNKVGIMVIGPVGEMKLPTATINVTDVDGEPCRVCARGGLGAVMGSKGIKAIIVDDGNIKSGNLKNNEKIREVIKKFAHNLRENDVMGNIFPKYGTAITLTNMNNLGGLPTKNFSLGQFEEAGKIDGKALYETITRRGGEGRITHNCMPGCVIKCSNKYSDENGKLIVSSLDYETLCLLGSNLLIGDLDEIAILNRLCNEYGIDTMEIGAALGVLAEGWLFDFGDFEKIKSLIEEVGKGTPLGRLIGSGCVVCGKAFGVERVPAVKNQGMAAYDPRIIKGNGVTYATSPMGADHTAGNTIISNVDHMEAKGKVELSREAQLDAVIMDTLGFCIFTARVILEKTELIEEAVEAICGWKTTFGKLQKIAMTILKKERKFNKKGGFTKAHDRLPEFLKKEPLLPNKQRFDVKDEEMDKIFD